MIHWSSWFELPLDVDEHDTNNINAIDDSVMSTVLFGIH